MSHWEQRHQQPAGLSSRHLGTLERCDRPVNTCSRPYQQSSTAHRWERCNHGRYAPTESIRSKFGFPELVTYEDSQACHKHSISLLELDSHGQSGWDHRTCSKLQHVGNQRMSDGIHRHILHGKHQILDQQEQCNHAMARHIRTEPFMPSPKGI